MLDLFLVLLAVHHQSPFQFRSPAEGASVACGLPAHPFLSLLQVCYRTGFTKFPTRKLKQTLLFLLALCPGVSSLHVTVVTRLFLYISYAVLTNSSTVPGRMFMFNTPPAKLVPVSSLPNWLRHSSSTQDSTRAAVPFHTETEVVFLYANVRQRSLAILSKAASCTKEKFLEKLLGSSSFAMQKQKTSLRFLHASALTLPAH